MSNTAPEDDPVEHARYMMIGMIAYHLVCVEKGHETPNEAGTYIRHYIDAYVEERVAEMEDALSTAAYRRFDADYAAGLNVREQEGGR